MRNPYVFVTGIMATALFAMLALAPVTADGQEQAKAKATAKGGPFPRQVTLFDREGKFLRTLGEPGLYGQSAFSPDGTRLAVTKWVLGLDNPGDIWVFDLSTGRSILVASGPVLGDPAWAPDGLQIAFSSRRNSSEGRYRGLYRKAADGTGSEELLYRHTLAANVTLTDWSRDGRFLFFQSGGVQYVVPLSAEQKAVEVAREEYGYAWARLSPDGRFLAYQSDESGRNELYVRAFDSSMGRFSPAGGKWQVSSQGAQGAIHWRQDGKELYYLASGAVMAAEVTVTPEFTAAPPKLLFRGPSGDGAGMSGDGQRFAFAVPMRPERKVITVAPEILAQYAGTYVLPFEADTVVTLEGNQLMIRLVGRAKSPLSAESETWFFRRTATDDNDIEFVKDDKGVVTHLVRYNGEGGEKYERRK